MFKTSKNKFKYRFTAKKFQNSIISSWRTKPVRKELVDYSLLIILKFIIEAKWLMNSTRYDWMANPWRYFSLQEFSTRQRYTHVPLAVLFRPGWYICNKMSKGLLQAIKTKDWETSVLDQKPREKHMTFA